MTSKTSTDRWMGKVEERLNNLCDQVGKESENARLHRESLRDVIAALSAAVKDLTTSVGEMRPDVRDYAKRRDEAAGAAKMAKVLWSFVATIFGLIGASAFELGRTLLRK